jgi:acyl carrier protein
MDMVTELKKALTEVTEIPVESLKDDVSLEQQGISSFQVITAYVSLERELNISFEGDQLPDIATATIEELGKSIQAIYVSR